MSRELDAEVARKVMGLTIEHANKAWSMEDWLGSDTPTERDTYAIVNSDWKPGASFPQYAVIPHYSTDIAAAWQVVEHTHLFDSPSERRKRGDDGDPWRVLGRKGNKWVVAEPSVAFGMYYDLGTIEPIIEADTPALAICLAALKALERRLRPATPAATR